MRGCAPRWQFCHVDDLVSALELAAAGTVTGDFAVGCDGSLSQAEVESLSGLKSVELPARLTFSAAQRLHRLGVTPAPSAELRYVVYPWVVDCAALRAVGWRPSFSNTEALAVLLAGRGGPPRGGRPPHRAQGRGHHGGGRRGHRRRGHRHRRDRPPRPKEETNPKNR